MTSIPDITLNNGQTIPQFGFGVFQIEPKDTAAAVSTALEAGYRHIDTAEMYGNEAEVGDAITRSGLDRREVFVTADANFHALTKKPALLGLGAGESAGRWDYPPMASWVSTKTE